MRAITLDYMISDLSKPRAIDELAKKAIGKMTADEYLTLARRTQNALDDVERVRREISDRRAKSRKRRA